MPKKNLICDSDQNPDLHARQALAKMVIKLFELWNLSPADQLNILGLNQKNRAALSKYSHGEALPASRDIQDRVGWLLAIHKSLRLLYPRNKKILYSWVNCRNEVFGNLTPLDVMKAGGIIGLSRVSRYLEFCQGQ